MKTGSGNASRRTLCCDACNRASDYQHLLGTSQETLRSLRKTHGWVQVLDRDYCPSCAPAYTIAVNEDMRRIGTVYSLNGNRDVLLAPGAPVPQGVTQIRLAGPRPIYGPFKVTCSKDNVLNITDASGKFVARFAFGDPEQSLWVAQVLLKALNEEHVNAQYVTQKDG